MNSEVLEALGVFYRELGNPDPEDMLFRSNRQKNEAISRIQAYRIIRSAADSLNIKQRVSCHSLRKSFGYHAWKSGAPVTVIMDIYNHNSLEVTKRYLGVCQDDRDQVYLHMDFLHENQQQEEEGDESQKKELKAGA